MVPYNTTRCSRRPVDSNNYLAVKLTSSVTFSQTCRVPPRLLTLNDTFIVPYSNIQTYSHINAKEDYHFNLQRKAQSPLSICPPMELNPYVKFCESRNIPDEGKYVTLVDYPGLCKGQSRQKHCTGC